MLYPLEHDMVYRIIRGLLLPLYLASKHLIAIGISFSQIVDYAKAIERAYIETYRGVSNKLCHQYNVIGISSESLFWLW